MNARRVEQEKITMPDGKSKLFPVIYEAGYIYDLDEVVAKIWIKTFIALPISESNTITLRNDKVVKLTPAKLAQLLREPGRPLHPAGGKKTRPALEDDSAPAPKTAKKKTTRKSAKKKTTRKSAKSGSKKSRGKKKK